MLPIFQQLVFPSLVAILAFVYSFFPQQGTHFQSHISRVVQREKNVVARILTPTPATHAQSHNSSFALGNTAYAQAPDSNTLPQQSGEEKISGQSVIVSQIPSGMPTPVHSQSAQTKMMHATLSISSNGKTIHLAMQYPSTGGNISGTISGDCSGTITGTYAGPATSVLSGSGSANCPMGFISVPVTLSYSGKLTSATQAIVSYTVNALGKTDGGSTSLAFSQ